VVRIGPSGFGVLWDPGDGLALRVSDTFLERPHEETYIRRVVFLSNLHKLDGDARIEQLWNSLDESVNVNHCSDCKV